MKVWLRRVPFARTARRVLPLSGVRAHPARLANRGADKHLRHRRPSTPLPIAVHAHCPHNAVLVDVVVLHVIDGRVFENLQRPAEIVIKLMARACGVDNADARHDAVGISYDDVPLVVASLETLIRTMQTVRPSDAADRQLLQTLLDEQCRR